jgi:ribonuclease HI
MRVHFDGSCQPPGGGGVSGWGFVIEGPGVRFEECGLAAVPYSPHSTNNVAEYVGAIRALEKLRSIHYSGEVIVEGDSQLVVRQMNGEYAVRADHLKAYHEWLGQLARSFQRVEFRWVPREENTVADALSKRAIESAAAEARRHRKVPAVVDFESDRQADSH